MQLRASLSRTGGAEAPSAASHALSRGRGTSPLDHPARGAGRTGEPSAPASGRVGRQGTARARVALCAALLGSAAAPAGATPSSPPTTLRALYGLTPPARLESTRTALLLVDFQAEFFDGRLPLRDARRALERAARLTRWAHAAGVWVVHVRNEAARPDSPIFAAGSRGSRPLPELEVSPGDRVLIKHLGGAFSRTELDRELRARGVQTVIVAGLMTHLAVAITASDAAVLGYQVIVAADATATRTLPGALGAPPVEAAVLQRTSLAILADRVADVLDTSAILALPLAPPQGSFSPSSSAGGGGG